MTAIRDSKILILKNSGGGDGWGHIEGFDIKRINAVSGIYITDVNGYIRIEC